MGKKPKAPDMSWQVQAAQQQENRLAQQQREIDIKTEQTAMSNTEKLRNIRRRALGRSILEPTRVAAPPSELSDVEKQKAAILALEVADREIRYSKARIKPQ